MTAPAVETTYGAPRTLLTVTVTVKRDNPHGLDLHGHWWVEAGERSWGWWPREIPVGPRQLARGTDGVLNGTGLVGRKGTWLREEQAPFHDCATCTVAGRRGQEPFPASLLPSGIPVQSHGCTVVEAGGRDGDRA